MTNSINIKIELSEADRARLDGLRAAIEKLSSQNGAPAVSDFIKEEVNLTPPTPEPPTSPQTSPVADEKPQVEEEPAKEEKTPENAPEPQATAQPQVGPAVSAEEIQRKVVDLCAKGKKAEVRDIINKYAEKVSSIPEDKRDEVMAQLNTLEG